MDELRKLKDILKKTKDMADKLKDPAFRAKALLSNTTSTSAAPKSDFRGPVPSKKGDFHNEAHVQVYVNGHRSIKGVGADKNTGENKFFNRKVDNKVKTTHIWDSNKKKWNHHKTEHTLGGLNVDGSKKFSGSPSKSSSSKSSNVTTPMDAARKRAEAAGHIKSVSPAKKPKTITRKLSKIEELKEKLEELKKGMDNSGLGGPGSVRAGMVKPSLPKLPKPGGNNSATLSVNVAQGSKKNPMKQAEQTQNKDIKDIKMKEAKAQLKGPALIKFEQNGQWSISYTDSSDKVVNGATVNEVIHRGTDVNVANKKPTEVTKLEKKG